MQTADSCFSLFGPVHLRNVPGPQLHVAKATCAPGPGGEASE